MVPKRAVTVAELLTLPAERLIYDRPCPTCGCEQWEPFEREGAKYLRCAGTWRNGDDCNRIVAAPVLKDSPLVSLESSVSPPPPPAPPRNAGGSGSADYETARRAMIADAEAIARRPEVKRERWVMEQARALKAISDARWAASPGDRPMPMPLEYYEEFFRNRR